MNDTGGGSFPGLRMIGERINPGFKSTKALFDEQDIEGIQALAVKQADAGASYLNVNIGALALTDPAWMGDVIRAIQEVVTVPLSFDFPSKKVQSICLEAYEPERAAGKVPIVNSITEHPERWELMDLYGEHRFKVIVMASERMEGDRCVSNTTAEDIYTTVKRSAERLVADNNMALGDIFMDMSISAIIADRDGLNRSTVEAIAKVGADPDLAGVHMMGGVSNIGQQMPPKAADGSPLKHRLECAFLTLVVPLGFDYALGTPWRGYHPLPEDDYVLNAYRAFLGAEGLDAIRAVRKFYRA